MTSEIVQWLLKTFNYFWKLSMATESFQWLLKAFNGFWKLCNASKSVQWYLDWKLRVVTKTNMKFALKNPPPVFTVQIELLVKPRILSVEDKYSISSFYLYIYVLCTCNYSTNVVQCVPSNVELGLDKDSNKVAWLNRINPLTL